jgi:hypothetical protein
MKRTKHPNKDIEKALRYAEHKGWLIDKKSGSSHAWGIMKCPPNNSFCRGGVLCLKSIWCTPKSTQNFANEIKRIVDGCQFLNEDS